jgi:hypothetical protein
MTDRIDRARRDVADARARLIDTARELQQRLAPKTLARDAWESAKVKGADLAEDAVDAVRKRPVAVGGAIAALTMFLAREPIKDGVANFYEAMNQRKKATKAKPRGNSAARSAVQDSKKRTRAPRKPAAPKVEKTS